MSRNMFETSCLIIRYQMLFVVIRGCNFSSLCHSSFEKPQWPAFSSQTRRPYAEVLAPTAWNCSDAHGASEEES